MVFGVVEIGVSFVVPAVVEPLVVLRSLVVQLLPLADGVLVVLTSFQNCLECQ